MKRFLFTNSRILTIFGIFFLVVGLVLVSMFFSEEPEVEKEGLPPVKVPDIVRRATTPPKPPLPPAHHNFRHFFYFRNFLKAIDNFFLNL